MTAPQKTKMFVIGSRHEGVVIVTLSPFRLMRISTATIEDYAKEIGKDADRVFEQIGRGFLSMAADLDAREDALEVADAMAHDDAYEHLFNTGLRVQHGDLALIVEIDASQHEHDHAHHPEPITSRRRSYTIIHDIVDTLLDKSASDVQPTELALKQPEVKPK